MKHFLKYCGFSIIIFLLVLMVSFWLHWNESFIFIISRYQSYITNLGQQEPIGDFKENALEGCHPGIDWDKLQTTSLPNLKYTKPSALQLPRTDVNILTPWLAPIIWEGTYNYDIINEQFKQGNHSIGLIVFAVKKYVQFLNEFLTTAELYFMLGHRVHYYVFTDRPEAVPKISLNENRFIHVLKTEPFKRWQDISMQRMESIRYHILNQFHKEVDYLVCADSDMKFNDHVGVEILGELVATIHPGFYASDRSSLPYERRSFSEAYVPKDMGDFYYMAAFYAGTVQEIYKLTSFCYESIEKDKKNAVEAVWHEESHFNKFLTYHKPTKVLSPEYIWDNNIKDEPFLKRKRFLAVPKNHKEIRN
ncbi:histo-blood group ABO system transferase-like [Protopterus annectens]|uniref:histo-blood group ABO system transferase-like n=1 Tax=Protopterus annectens TaxID=7888 RepID=UPI001CFB508F|nr:histo-blood group ABO system transferase-like [Protopterus annectens]XP_043937422.1 histo-blood group ABO system transferase-like [Protopterus annectens]